MGDVDSDGVPEIVSVYRSDDNDDNNTKSVINVFQAPATGTTLNIDKQINVKPDGMLVAYEDIAMADVNRDGCTDYFIVSKSANSTNYKIGAYTCTGAKLWSSTGIIPERAGPDGSCRF